MTETSHAALTAALTSRWPEHRVAPSLTRVAALMDLLGEPQRAYPVIQVAGTNGKGSTAIMIETLLRSAGLRTGRFSSPHLSDVRERIVIDGEPISEERFAEVWADIEPYVGMVDEQQLDGVAMTFFEVITGMAYAAFADAPVDVAVMEVGLGGRWDATSVADASVAVVTPIGMDHTHILGNTLTEIAGEKAGIIKPGGTAVFAGQAPEAAKVLLAAAVEAGASMKAEGPDFGLLERGLAVGGQLLRIESVGGPVADVFLPLYGEHMARNAVLAVAAVEAFLGGKPLNPEIIVEGLGAVEAPARLELVRTSPPIVIDTAHNTQAARATIDAVEESFDFAPTIGVVAMMQDKDAAEVLEIFAEKMDQVVITQVSSTSRARPVDDLAAIAETVWETSKVHRAASMREALDLAVMLADTASVQAGVLVAGSVIAAGEARDLLKKKDAK
ncbi:bifunctional folylpolyglutamate synthase/dihydrofolate synthase [Tessaracoccus sp. MC1865]|uniref:bifunctional folylpolyglutamate synthase/dihydrofolate synthase n=1 Tax=Tessaracoccus sp. MC1865 TaxID=2760310 RepID=UPI0016031BD8|nr:folylpolyglutamate synthase/dihydrofolate synthase family protein [Tessaracoccus sp. MC1865]MBB1484375.1 bifunctional folylpolyglutamate synthase/dihydrofolate synthase [Tessaracoccus sp. MC1865]QTO38517.1 bifunctional folylpolyglutamate synthase/dihydrofolate synthase [Tessaracoccus sp. MC1865]